MLICSLTRASHIVGGDITIRWIAGNEFEATVISYRDCGGPPFPDPGYHRPFPPTIDIGVYDLITNSMITTFSMNLGTVEKLVLGDACYTPTGMCIEKGTYQNSFSLTSKPNGYYITWSTCCRNAGIKNLTPKPDDVGMTFYMETPDAALQNSSPTFGNYPNAYMCINQTNKLDLSALDSDPEDSLVYSLIRPLDRRLRGNSLIDGATNIPPISGPYPGITWKAPYTDANSIGGNPPMKIDAKTGIFTATPNSLGIFVFAVKVEEYRNGNKIGEIRRDMQYQVLPCDQNIASRFVSPISGLDTSYIIIAGESLCTDIKLLDQNTKDSLKIYASSELFSGADRLPVNTFHPVKEKAATVQTQLCLTTTCENIRPEPYIITLYGQDSSCYGNNFDTLTIKYYVMSPFDGSIDTVIPNVFTPNGDGVNDTYHVKAKINYCFDTFHIQIFSRWGENVFEDRDFLFNWDGKKNGSDLPSGMYYYLLEAKFLASTVQKHGFIELIK